MLLGPTGALVCVPILWYSSLTCNEVSFYGAAVVGVPYGSTGRYDSTVRYGRWSSHSLIVTLNLIFWANLKE